MSELPRTQSALVVSAFPATGKSYLAGTFDRIYDSDSSHYSGRDNWPANYFNHIRARLADPYAWAVMVSTHKEVREGLVFNAIPFTLVYPDPSLREEYRERMQERGSSPWLVAKVCDELWDSALADCAKQEGCTHVVLRSGQYLADVVRLRVANNAA